MLSRAMTYRMCFMHLTRIRRKFSSNSGWNAAPCRLCCLVKRAPDGETWLVENMRINHGSRNVPVPKQLLNGTNILSIFQQMSRETVPECMATGRFGHSRFVDRSFDRILKILFRNVMPTPFA